MLKGDIGTGRIVYQGQIAGRVVRIARGDTAAAAAWGPAGEQAAVGVVGVTEDDVAGGIGFVGDPAIRIILPLRDLKATERVNHFIES